MTPFGLGTFSQGTGPRFAGLCLDGQVHSLPSLSEYTESFGPIWAREASVLDLLAEWDRHLPVLQQLADALTTQGAKTPVPASMTTLNVHAPVDLPRQIICTGANYRKHVVQLSIDMKVGPAGLEGDALRSWAEDMMDTRAKTGEPYAFPKLVSAVCGANDAIRLPATTKKPDWELELGVVIGKAARNVRRDRALEHVAGYAIVNDVSARDLIARTDYPQLGTDWLAAKSPPTFLPFGPLLVPACFVPNPQDLRLTLKLNDRTMQDESTADMMFDVARQIEYLSHHIQLLPGDLICTGSPAGNGTHYNRFLQPGDVVESTITGLGTQRNVCIAEGDIE